MFEDLYNEYFILGAISLLIFIAAFAAFWLSFIFFPTLFVEKSIAKRFLRALRFPVLALFMLLAAFLSFNLYDSPPHVENTISHILLIFLIATFGWLSGALLRNAYTLIREHYEKGALFDLSKRSALTQAQFLYRLLMLGVIALSLGSILMTFPAIKSIGVGILGSAGIAGIALGIAARPILLNFIAGFQIAMTKMIKIGDAVVIEKEQGRIEVISLTHVTVKTWDLRHLIVPVSYFIDKPYQNWTVFSTDLYATAYIHCDFTADVEKMRQKLHEILEESPLWDKKVWDLLVTNISERTLQLRATMSVRDTSNAFPLQCYVREKIIGYLQKESLSSLPQIRIEKKD